MIEKPIKVDEKTDRLVTDLAYFLRCSKKTVVREAVTEFAEARRAGTALPGNGTALPGNGAALPGAGAGQPRAATILDLALVDRVAVRRNELIREFAKRRATNVRLFTPATETEAIAEVHLLVETDLADGTFVIPALEEVARTLLTAPVHIVSSTALALFSPVALERVLAESRPL